MEDSNLGRTLTIGDAFPKVDVQTTKGSISLPEYYKGKWVVLFSHPGDFTPVCTTEFVSFELYKESFAEMNTELIGLSIDQVYSHLKWIEWIKENINVQISFPIIADPLGRLAQTLGMIHHEKGTRTVRAVFILDTEGIIRQILLYPMEVGRSIAEIWRSVHALQTSDLYNVAMPENWPNNPLLGSKVILPPAGTEQEIQKRLKQKSDGEIDCLDWWLCYKDLFKNKG